MDWTLLELEAPLVGRLVVAVAVQEPDVCTQQQRPRVEAGVLVDLSGGKQLLRGNSVFGPAGVDRIELEVWQDSGTSVEVRGASLDVRPLPAPAG